MIIWRAVRDFHWNLDVFLTDILDVCMAFFLVQLFLHQFEISVTLLLLSGSTLFFGDISVGHIAGLIDQGLAPFDNLALISRHCDGIALDLRDLFTLFPHICFKPGRLTFFQVASLSPLSVLFVSRAVKVVKVFKFSLHIIFLPAFPGAMMRRVELVELIPSELIVVLDCKMVRVPFLKSRGSALALGFLRLSYERAQGL